MSKINAEIEYLIILNENYRWDIRDPGAKPKHSIEAHKAEVNCIKFSPANEHILLTGSADKVILLAVAFI